MTLTDREFIERCLAPTGLLDFEHPAVGQFVADAIGSAESHREQAVRLFYAVRDRIRYDPFQFSRERDDYRASVPKAGLLAAAARAVGIPAAVGLADVTNHLNTPKLREAMGGVDVFYDHGYTALWLDGRWVKAAAVFNIELCRRFGVRPTEFDGVGDALLQEYDQSDRRHMQYLRDHGMFDDLPFERMIADFDLHYPGFGERLARLRGERFEAQQRL
jgi:transglutaminase-like putative cysteine protease